MQSSLTAMNETLVSSKLQAAEEAASLKSTITSLRSQVSALQSSVSAARSDQEKSVKDLADKSNTLNLTNLTVADLKSSLASLRCKLKASESEKEELGTLSGELQAKLMLMNNEKLAWHDERESLRHSAAAGREGAEEELAKANRERDETVREARGLRDAVARGEESQTSLKKRLAKEEKEKVEIQGKLDDLLSYTQKVESSKASLSSAVDALTSEVTKTKSGAKSVIDTLKHQIATLTEEGKEKDGRLKDLKGYMQEREALTKAVEEERSRSSGLQSRLSRAEAAAEEERTKSTKVTEDSKQHLQKRHHAKSEAQKLLKRLATLQARHDELDSYLKYTALGKLEGVKAGMRVVLGRLVSDVEAVAKRR